MAGAKSHKPSTVLFLGAGASRACGYLLTSEILPEIIRLLAGDPKIEQQQLRSERRLLLERLKTLLPGAFVRKGAAAGSYAMGITDLLSLLDHAIRTGEEFVPVDSEGSHDGQALREVRHLLNHALVEVLASRRREKKVGQTELVRWIGEQYSRNGQYPAVISTNYDVSVDLKAFPHVLGNWWKNHWQADFGFSWRDPDDGAIVPPPLEPRLRLYKLHGSLNWLGCPRCGFIYVNFMLKIGNAGAMPWLDDQCHCLWEPLRPVLVAPSLARDIREPNLQSIWLKAGEALRRAERWVFIGYSLPAEDLAIRSMLLRAWHGADASRPAIFVVDLNEKEPDQESDPIKRYQALFGKVSWRTDGLEGLMKQPKRWKESR